MSIWHQGFRSPFGRCAAATTVVLGLAAAMPAALLSLTAASPAVWAQDSGDVKVLLDRMERLERDIRALNLNVTRGTPMPAPRAAAKFPPAPDPDAAAPAGPAVARLGVKISDLESDVRAATGAMEDLGFRINEIKSRLDKLVADVDFRLGALEGRAQGAAPRTAPGTAPGTAQAAPQAAPPRISAAPAPPPVQKVIPGQGGSFATPPGTLGTVSEKAVSALNPPGAGAAARPAPSTAPAAVPAPAPAPPAAPSAAGGAASSVLPQGSAKEQYRYAFGLLRQANYDRAEQALQEFVQLHPKEPLTSNARYWLGETFYVRAAYVQAAEVFLEGYQADPKGPKAPDSLLKLGMSLAALEKTREACAAFDKLIKDFPDLAAGVKNTVARERQKSGCT